MGPKRGFTPAKKVATSPSPPPQLPHTPSSDTSGPCPVRIFVNAPQGYATFDTGYTKSSNNMAKSMIFSAMRELEVECCGKMHTATIWDPAESKRVKNNDFHEKFKGLCNKNNQGAQSLRRASPSPLLPHLSRACCVRAETDVVAFKSFVHIVHARILDQLSDHVGTTTFSIKHHANDMPIKYEDTTSFLDAVDQLPDVSEVSTGVATEPQIRNGEERMVAAEARLQAIEDWISLQDPSSPMTQCEAFASVATDATENATHAGASSS